MSHSVMLTDSGLETDLIFHHGHDLPDFASFPLLDDAAGRDLLRQYFRDHIEVAERAGLGIVLETPTWRASADWGDRLGYAADDLERINRDAVELVAAAREGFRTTVLVSGCLGPRGDGYQADTSMTADEAEAYHAPQVRALRAADLVSALTISTAAEATGIVRAVVGAGLPVVISFTVEVDGRLPDSTTLAAAIREVDEGTDGAASWFMVNCAHPDHLAPALSAGGAWLERLHGVRANASRRSHAELDVSTDLDDGDPIELARGLLAIHRQFPSVRILGGCCGTDVRHVHEIANALVG